MADTQETKPQVVGQITKEALALLSTEKVQFETESAFITPKVSYEMRNVIERARKNYYGVFDAPVDSNTGLDKIWVPLTEWSVENVVKNSDLDSKDANLRARKKRALPFATLVRAVMQQFLKRMGFGEIIDDGLRTLSIDGTWVQKSWKGFDPRFSRQTLKTSKVDLMNFYIDPHSKSIQAAHSVMERGVLTQSEVNDMQDRWLNLDKVNYQANAVPNIENLGFAGSKVPVSDFYWRWGKMPRYLITGAEDDRTTWVDGLIIASGIGGKAAAVHKIMTNPKRQKPYEEAWLRRVPGRWHGRGVSEQLFSLQEYVNETVNTRRNTNLYLQNRLFEVRKGSGITGQMLSRLVTGGAIQVSEIGRDIREFQVSDQKPSSYNDEDRIYGMAERVSGAFPISAGEQLPASTPATNAVIQNQNAKSTFLLVQEGMGMFLKRLIENHWLPMIFDVIQDEELAAIMDDAESLRGFDEAITGRLLNESIVRFVNKTGFHPEPEDIEREREKVKNEFKKLGNTRFLDWKKKLIDTTDYEVDVYFTNEEFDKATLVQNLERMLLVYSRLTESRLDVDGVIKETLDILGIGGERFLKAKPEPVNVKPLPNDLQGGANLNPQQIFAGANL